MTGKVFSVRASVILRTVAVLTVSVSSSNWEALSVMRADDVSLRLVFVLVGERGRLRTNSFRVRYQLSESSFQMPLRTTRVEGTHKLPVLVCTQWARKLMLHPPQALIPLRRRSGTNNPPGNPSSPRMTFDKLLESLTRPRMTLAQIIGSLTSLRCMPTDPQCVRGGLKVLQFIDDNMNVVWPRINRRVCV